MKIRLMMSIILASIILIDCIYATYVISLNYKQSQEKQKLADFTDQSVKLASGILELSLERSATQLALRTTKKENLKLLDPIIKAQRDKSNNYFKSLIEDINKKNNIKNKDFLILNLNQLIVKIDDLRHKADSLIITENIYERNKFAEKFSKLLPSIISQISDLRFVLNSENVTIPPRIRINDFIQYYSWKIREIGGKSRTLIAQAILDNSKISDDDIKKIALFDDEVQRAFNVITKLEQSEVIDNNVKKQILNVKTEYFNKYQNLTSSIIESSINSKTYNIDFKEFFTISSAALNQAEKLLAVAAESSQNYLNIKRQELKESIIFNIFISALSISMCIVLLIFTRNGIVLKVQKLTQIMNEIASGKYNQDFSGLISNNEIGKMAESVKFFETNNQEIDKLRKINEETEKKSQEQRKDFIQKMANNFENQVQNVMHEVNNIIKLLVNESSELKHKSEENERKITTIANMVSDSSNSISYAAKSTDGLSSSIKDITNQTAKASDITGNTVSIADTTKNVVSKLSEGAAAISEVVGLIKSIAEKINLLSLNASIEAARAGEFGKGFNVVANEVKALANQTKQAIHDIHNKAININESTNEAVNAVNDIITKINEINSIATVISKSVSAQDVETDSISGNIQKINSNMINALKDTKATSETFKVSKEFSEHINKSVIDLNDKINNLNNSIMNFIKSMREQAN